MYTDVLCLHDLSGYWRTSLVVEMGYVFFCAYSDKQQGVRMKKKNIITVIGSILLGGPVVAGGIAKKIIKGKKKK